MADSNLIRLMVVNLTIYSFFSLLCAEAVPGGPDLESSSAIGKLRRMEFSIRAVQSGRNETQLSGAVAPLTRWGGAYLVTVAIGTPPSSFQGQVDTGSDLIWFRCSNYTFQPSPYRRVPCSSSLCSALGNSTCAPDCQYSPISMENLGTKGDLIYETFTMADTIGATRSFDDVAVGCSRATQNNGVEYGEGVVGLGRGPLSLISQIGESKFSYCLPAKYYGSEFDGIDDFSTPLLFGSAAELRGTGVQSTMMVNNTVLPKLNSYYYLSVERMSVGNVSLNIPKGTFDIQANGSGGFIIDSGTQYTLLPHAAFTALASVLDSALGLPRDNSSGRGSGLCYPIDYYGYVPLVNITFHMAGADYIIQGKHNFILLNGPDFTHLLCLAMFDMDEASVAGAPAVLGNFQQQDYHILYDIANQRVSFTPTRCRSLYMFPYPSYVQSKSPILKSHALLLLLLLYFTNLLLAL